MCMMSITTAEHDISIFIKGFVNKMTSLANGRRMCVRRIRKTISLSLSLFLIYQQNINKFMLAAHQTRGFRWSVVAGLLSSRLFLPPAHINSLCPSSFSHSPLTALMCRFRSHTHHSRDMNEWMIKKKSSWQIDPQHPFRVFGGYVQFDFFLG